MQSERQDGTTFYNIFESEDVDSVIVPPDYSELINREGVALIQEEYSKLFSLSPDQIQEEVNTYSSIVNFKFGSPANFLDLKPEFAPLLKPILIYINLFKVKNKGSTNPIEIDDNTFNTLKVLVYKSLLLAVNIEEAKEMLKSLAFVLSSNTNENKFNGILASTVYNTSKKELE